MGITTRLKMVNLSTRDALMVHRHLKRGEHRAADEILSRAADFESLDLDKDYLLLQAALGRLDPPRESLLEGVRLGDDAELVNAGYFSAALVKSVAAQFHGVRFEPFFEAFLKTEFGKGLSPGRMEEERGALSEYLAELKEFFASAAEEGLAVIINHA